jgi:hypothetical protein
MFSLRYQFPPPPFPHSTLWPKFSLCIVAVPVFAKAVIIMSSTASTTKKTVGQVGGPADWASLPVKRRRDDDEGFRR